MRFSFPGKTPLVQPSFEKNCYDFARQSLEPPQINEWQYRYGTATYTRFLDAYERQDERSNHLSRKIAALPKALVALGKTIAHIALMIFVVPKALLGNKKPLAYFSFCIRRDFQEVFGRILSLFHDKLGLYHIQESQFQKQCYLAYFYEANLLNKAEKELQDSSSFARFTLKEIIYEKTKKERLLLELAKKEFNCQSFDSAYHVVIEISHNYKGKEELLLKLANHYFSQRYLDVTLEVLKQITHDLKGKENLLFDLAKRFFINRYFDEAQAVIQEISEDQIIKKDFLIQLAEQYFLDDNFDKAREVLEEIASDHKEKQDLLEELEGKYNASPAYFRPPLVDPPFSDPCSRFDAGERREGSMGGYDGYDIREVNRLFYNRQFNKILKTINKTYGRNCDFLLKKLANKYFNDQRFREALFVIKDLRGLENRDYRSDFIWDLVTIHCKEEDSFCASEAIELLIKDSMGVIDVNDYFLREKIAKHLAPRCYEKMKDLLKSNLQEKAKVVLGEIVSDFMTYGDAQESTETPVIEETQEVPQMKEELTIPEPGPLKTYYEACKGAKPENYYAILGLSEPATEQEVRKACNKILQKIHPDKVLEKDRATAEAVSSFINGIRDFLIKRPLEQDP